MDHKDKMEFLTVGRGNKVRMLHQTVLLHLPPYLPTVYCQTPPDSCQGWISCLKHNKLKIHLADKGSVPSNHELLAAPTQHPNTCGTSTTAVCQEKLNIQVHVYAPFPP